MPDLREEIEALSSKQRQLLKLLLQREVEGARQPARGLPRQEAAAMVATVARPAPRIAPAAPEQRTAPIADRYGDFPLSFSQQRLWLLDQLQPHNSAFNIPNALRMTGSLDTCALARGLRTIVRRHGALRTAFTIVDGQPVQSVAPARWADSAPILRAVLDLRGLTAEQRESATSSAMQEDASHPFDLATAPLLRTTLLRLDENDHMVLLNIHHIVSDGWSMGVIIKELAALYAAYAYGRQVTLPGLPIQYVDYASQQRARLQGAALESLVSYWRKQLAGAPPLLDLPTDRPRPAVQSHRGATHTQSLPAALGSALTALSQREGATLFMTLLAAFQTLLARYARQDDISVGTFVANRTNAESEPLVGFFVNTLALRTDLSGDPTFRALIQRARSVCLGAYAHQDLPFEKLLEELHPARALDRTPLFQAMLVLQNTPRQSLSLPNLTITTLNRQAATQSNFDLTLWVRETPSGPLCDWDYSTDLFDPDTIARMSEHFQTLLEGVAADPDRPISALPLSSPAEQRRIRSWGAGAPAPAEAGFVHQRIAAQAARTPDAVAVVGTGRHLTYEALNRRANQLAHHLRANGAGAEQIVGLRLERSPELIVALLGALKAGSAYLPLDPSYPAERLALMLEDSGATVIVTNEGRAKDEGSEPAFIDLRADWPIIAAAPDADPRADVQPEQQAYVIYTSGSTGRPKGVMVTHGALARYTATARAKYALAPGDRALQFASANFDTSAEEIFPCLESGAMLALRSEWMLGTPAIFLRACRELAISVLNLPTSYWHLLAAELGQPNVTAPKTLRLTIIGGERAMPERLANWRRHIGPRVELVNTYGPTEATIVTTMQALAEAPDGRELPLGRPVPQAQVYILDRRMRLAPIGVPGELYIGGDGLARGYLKRPDLTAERFIPNPFGTRNDEDRTMKESDSSFLVPRSSFGARLYRTGDLARYAPDGALTFVGRVDGQIKLRGYRIELGEVAAALERHEAVRECVVTVREDAPGDRRLVAYVVAGSEVRVTSYERLPSDSDSSLVTRRSSLASELRAFLADRLPAYMVPAAFVELDALPISPNGKIDRSALPAPDPAHAATAAAWTPPQTDVQHMLAEIWSQVLGVERIGIYDNFFSLGGHSLLVAQLMFRLRDTFQIDLPLRTLFEQPMISAQALAIEEALMDDIDALSEDEMLELGVI